MPESETILWWTLFLILTSIQWTIFLANIETLERSAIVRVLALFPALCIAGAITLAIRSFVS